MKRILKQLIKLFPDRYVIIEKEYKVYKYTDDNIASKIEYSAYIANYLFNDRSAWSNSYDTLLELDKMLDLEIKDYKRMIKD